MPRSAKLATGLILLHFVALAFVAIAKPEYDGGDLPALVFWIVISNVLLIIGGAILLFHLLRWFVNKKNDGF